MNWECKESISEFVGMMRAGILTASSTTTISQQQNATLQESAIKGPSWVSKFTVPPPKNDHVRTLLLRVIDELADGNAPRARPKSEAIDLQWTGYRKGVGSDTPQPSISEKEKYDRLMKDVLSPLVIFYIYGGAFLYVLLDDTFIPGTDTFPTTSMNTPGSYRKTVTRLAQMTGARCLTVRQRLAPQNPFPAALLDVFHAYMSLLSPPPGSPHDAVPASSIILAGDSSGGCLALALLQMLLTLKRQNLASKVEYHGRMVDIELPAGITLISAVGELTNSLPSYKLNVSTDVLPAAIPFIQPEFPTCKIWPSKPPRGNLYCDAPTLCHPLASPTASKDWIGSPPMFFASGQEMIVDGVKVIAQTAFSQGTTVVFQEYEAMPHIFLWSCAGSPQSRKCWHDWAGFCKAIEQGRTVASRAVLVKPKGLHEVGLNINKLTPLTVNDAYRMMREAAKKIRSFSGHQMGISML